MNKKKCLKCGHIAQLEEASPALACPECGAIYSKVEAASSTAAFRPTPLKNSTSAKTPRRPQQRQSASDLSFFAEDLRKNSLYPTWRELVKWTTLLGYAVAALTLIVTAVSTSMAFVPTLIAFGVSVFIVVIVRVGKEVSLMLSDLSDAAVRIAAQMENP